MDFGLVVALYKGSPVLVRKQIAHNLGINTTVLDSWLLTVNTVRNICAHHGRLWNRTIGNPPKIPRSPKLHDPYDVKNDKMFGTLTMLSYLLERIAPDTSWRKRLLDMMFGLTRRNQERMGFTGEWRECLLWKPYLSNTESTEG